ncbi:MAG: HEPN domain-containing protein [Thermoplasmata archaeon]|nr:HEPN domain-containing protein [Thermoplasmata archaeon]
MSYNDMESEGLIRKTRIDKKRVEDSLDLARRDIETAESVMDKSCDWAYNIAYNAMLQACRALMFSLDYRPTGRNQHVSVVRFAEEALGGDYAETILLFERMRRNRHISVYDTPGTISETQAKNAIAKARELLAAVEGRIG